MDSNLLLIALCVFAIVLGLFVIFSLFKNKRHEGDDEQLAHKQGLPILPRDQRDIKELGDDGLDNQGVGETPTNDALSSLAEVASQNPPTPSDETPNNAYSTNPAPSSPSVPKLSPSHQDKVHDQDVKMDFQENSPLLDKHLAQQEIYEQNNDPIFNAKDTVTIVITPKDHILSGRKILEIVKSYDLKYGVMNMYHRYERNDGTGDLWFSMLGVGRDGVMAFDINTLVESQFYGLSLFLSLPHPNAVKGFDAMVKTAKLIAKELNADIHDEEGYIFDDNYLKNVRLDVTEYR